MPKSRTVNLFAAFSPPSCNACPARMQRVSTRCPQACPQALWIGDRPAGIRCDATRSRLRLGARCRSRSVKQMSLVNNSPSCATGPVAAACRGVCSTLLSAGLSTGLVDSARRLAKKSPNTRRRLPGKGCSTLSTALPQRFSTACCGEARRCCIATRCRGRFLPAGACARLRARPPQPRHARRFAPDRDRPDGPDRLGQDRARARLGGAPRRRDRQRRFGAGLPRPRHRRGQARRRPSARACRTT